MSIQEITEALASEHVGLTVSTETIQDFLMQFRPQGLQNLVAIGTNNTLSAATFKMPSQMGQAVTWVVQQNKQGRNVYFTVNPVTEILGKKPRKTDIAGAEYLHVDIDPDTSVSYDEGRARLLNTTLSELKAFEVPPSFIVDSGNGLGVFWRVDEASIEEAEGLNKALIAHFGGDSGTGNIDRLMRLPGTWNYPTPNKIAKGYPEGPRLSSLLHALEGRCTLGELRDVLPVVEARVPTESRSVVSSFSEDSNWLSADEVKAITERLDVCLETSPSLRRRWHGETDGLTDTSRSALDFSLTALLKGLGFTYQETAYLVTQCFKHGKGAENTDRDLERNWERCGAAAPDEIIALCVEAKANGDAWEPLLYEVRPNAQTVDHTLETLAKFDGFSGKRVLKQDYESYAAEQAQRESQQRVQKEIGDRLALIWDPTRMNEMVEQTEQALMSYPGHWDVLLYGGAHSRVALKPPTGFHRIDDAGGVAPSVPVFEPYNQQGMLLRIEQSVAFYKKEDGRSVLIAVPDKIAGFVLNKPDSKLPVTVGLVSHPLVLQTGSLLLQEGLDSRSGIYVHFGGASFQDPGGMSPKEGVEILRTEMLGEFAFASEADEAAALALILTAIERKTMDMAPGFMINASTQGSGKTTLARMAHLLVTGRDMPVAGMSENVEEQSKALTAMLLASVPIVCFDNVPDAFKVASPVLARALTSQTHTDRILGLSKMVELPTNTVFVVTGNNITADIDLSRRLLEIRLEPKEERPEQRRFANPDVVDHVLRNRARWMQAALAILGGSREEATEGASSGFSQWDRIVRWPLVNAGVADPVSKFDEVRANSPDQERLVAWMLGLKHGFGVGQAFRARDLVHTDGTVAFMTSRSDENRDPRILMYKDYLADYPPPKGWGNANSISWMINRLIGRTVQGYTLTKKTVHGSTHYVIEQR